MPRKIMSEVEFRQLNDLREGNLLNPMDFIRSGAVTAARNINKSDGKKPKFLDY